MSEKFKPERPSKPFKDYIELNTPMTPEQAIFRLGNFHGTNNQNIKEAFFNLRNQQASSVKFYLSEGTRNGNDVIIMEGLDSAGKRMWSSRIDEDSGQPVAHTS